MAAGGQTKAAYLDSTLGADARARDLLGRMTLEEKVRQMSACRTCCFLKNGKVSGQAVRKFFRGLSIGTMRDAELNPRESAEAMNAVQKYLVEQTRFGIPAIVHAECLHGHSSGRATIFPQAIGQGSTWNPGLIGRMAQAIAKEARAVGVTQALSPDLDLGRDPRWGRLEESYGEDPFHVSRMGVAYIRGMQGGGGTIDREHLVCTIKHFAAHGSPERGINTGPVSGGMRELRSLYLPPFKAAVMEAGALSVMPAYSEYDGIPASASKLLLTRILRDEWGFAGYVFSDYCAIEILKIFHKTAASPADAGRQALAAGLDLEAPFEYAYGDVLLQCVRRGEVPVELVDRAVMRILRVKFLAGLFENPYVDARRAERVVNCAAHRALAREVARESIVLLKNDGNLLPLKRSIRRIAVIGPNADKAQFGDYTFPNLDAVTPLQGVKGAVSKRTQVVHARGCHLHGLSRDNFAAAVEAARSSDAAIVIVGDTSHSLGGVGWGAEGEAATCGEGFDNGELTLPGVQEELVRAVHATGTPTIAVLVNGRPYSIPWLAENVPAIVEAWYPGEQGSNALADILFGKVNPSGRLTVSVPRGVGHIPACYNHKPSSGGYYHKPGTPEKPGRDYVFSDPAPLFPFGHGLSYTTFKYSNLRVSPCRISADGKVNVSVTVRNTGRVAGKEVVQLYLTDVVSSVTTPVKALRRFEKIDLLPGRARTVSFTLNPEDLGLYDEEMCFVVEPGEFEVAVGCLKKRFEVVQRGGRRQA